MRLIMCSHSARSNLSHGVGNQRKKGPMIMGSEVGSQVLTNFPNWTTNVCARVPTNGPPAEKCMIQSPDNGLSHGQCLSPSPDMPKIEIQAGFEAQSITMAAPNL